MSTTETRSALRVGSIAHLNIIGWLHLESRVGSHGETADHVDLTRTVARIAHIHAHLYALRMAQDA